MSYFDSRYLTLIGHVQSGKTIEEINYCYSSIKTYKRPVVFIVRNVKADQLQLRERFSSYNMNVTLLHLVTVDAAVEFMEKLGVIILLANTFQLQKIKNVLTKYNKDYNVCIDEVDFSIKTRDNSSPTDRQLSVIKKNASHILGATATPFALFSNDKTVKTIRKIKSNKTYKGIESLHVKFVNSCIIRSEDNFPLCDMEAMDEIYSEFLEKEHGVILHTVVKERENHYKIQNYLSREYPQMTVITYNGDGIKVIVPNRKNDQPFADDLELNKYRQLINKYSFDGKIHTFINYAISDVLQLLVQDARHDHTHICIIAGHLASRGISFVSSDYSLHLTDQYLYGATNAHGENLLQSLRILGCYKDNCPLTLWCSEKTWKSILRHNEIINDLVYNLEGETQWMMKINEIYINKPTTPLTRPKLCNYNVSPSNDFYKLCIKYHEEENELETK